MTASASAQPMRRRGAVIAMDYSPIAPNGLDWDASPRRIAYASFR